MANRLERPRNDKNGLIERSSAFREYILPGTIAGIPERLTTCKVHLGHSMQQSPKHCVNIGEHTNVLYGELI